MVSGSLCPGDVYGQEQSLRLKPFHILQIKKTPLSVISLPPLPNAGFHSHLYIIQPSVTWHYGYRIGDRTAPIEYNLRVTMPFHHSNNNLTKT